MKTIKIILEIVCRASAIVILIINPCFWIFVALNGFNLKRSIIKVICEINGIEVKDNV